MKKKKSTKLIHSLAVILLALALYLTSGTGLLASGDNTDSGNCGANAQWVYNLDTKELNITGTGDIEDYYGGNMAPWFIYKDEIKKVTVDEGITRLGDYSFYMCSKMQTLIVPETLEEIGKFVCYMCYSVKTLYVPASVTEIGANGFSGTHSLENVIVDDNNPYFRDIDGVLFDKACKKLIEYPAQKPATNYIIPASVTRIATNSFRDTEFLESIDIPLSVTEVGNYAFMDCEKLRYVYIPKTVTDLGQHTFKGCINLTAVDVNPENTAYKSVDGVIFTKDGTSLLRYPAGKPTSYYTLPDEVVSIAWYAFAQARNLYSVECGKESKLESIGAFAFDCCDALNAIELPDGLKCIDYCAFTDCDNLKYVKIPESILEVGEYALGFKCHNSEDATGYEPEEGFVLKGLDGSPAYSYAEKNNMVFIGYTNLEPPDVGAPVEPDEGIEKHDSAIERIFKFFRNIREWLMDMLHLTSASETTLENFSPR